MKKIVFLVLYMAAVIGCNTTVENSTDEHAHEAKLQLIAYNNDFEVFAEADPFSVGNNSGILAHFTWLESFKPLRSGKVTMSLIVGTNGIRQTLDKPTREGIYAFVLQPQFSGRGRIIFSVETEKGESEIVVDGISVFPDSHSAEHDVEDKEITSSLGVVFTKEQSWKTDFATDLPKQEPFGQIIKTTALVKPAPGGEIVVSSKTNGIVSFTDNSVLEGKTVTAGQVLFSVSGSELAENNIAVRFAEAKSNFEKAEADYNRLRELAEEKIISDRELRQAKNQYENTKAVYDNLKNFSSGGQNVYSPMNGYIKQIFASNGMYLEPGQPVLSIAQNNTLMLHADVQQKYLPVLDSIRSANIRTLHDNKTYSFQELNGKILSVGKSVHTNNFLIPVVLQVENTSGLLTGSFVELYLKTVTNTQALTVPNTALLEEQGIYSVFVQVTPELFEKQEVKTGTTDGLKTEILHGLSKEDRIVTNGAVLVKLAQNTGALDAHSGHVH
jgi:membrane fusion protein, heavy metal efflux system